MKQCTWCGKEHDDAATRCIIDSQPLELVAPMPVRQQEHAPANPRSSNSSEGFLFPRHIGRFSFVVRYLLFMAALWVGVLPLSLSAGMQPGAASIAVLALSPITLLVALIYFIRFVAVARIRDIGINSRYALLVFVPVVNIALFLMLAFVPKNGFSKQSSSDALITPHTNSAR